MYVFTEVLRKQVRFVASGLGDDSVVVPMHANETFMESGW